MKQHEKKFIMSQRPLWKLASLTYHEVSENDYEVAVIPFGATEPHNLHLPYATDTLESEVIGDAVCQRAHELGGKVILLPTIPYGTETNQQRCKLSMNLNPSTVNQIITDLVESLVNHGIKKIVILNSHGGNEFKPHLRELQGQTDAHIFLCDWFRMIGDVYSDIFEHPEDHAGEMETSIMLATFSELVERNVDGGLRADDGQTRPLRFEALNKKWVSISRRWDLLTTNTGSGNPHNATEEKGRKVLDIITGRLAIFLKELSDAKIDEHFPFEPPDAEID
jgi:creatinine amidohydrolase